MSRTIDERVLEMRFDNRQFESGVSTTMSTLDKLKQKLHFKDAAKGLEDVGYAAKKVDLSGIGKSAETVGLKFNAMYTIADQALRNITNSAMMYGKQIVSALTIDPIKTGLSEYETKVGAIQVIKANTRSKYDSEETQMAEIERVLSVMNDYADRTIYNYTQMTDNLGKFVNQGLDLDEAANAVMGLANLAGASGASAQDMARATYQMSQAMGSVIRKIDWNSLRNANMAGTELKNVLTDLARVEGIDIDAMIEEKGIFEETLEKGWLTGELFTKAMNIYSDVYSEAELKAMGFNDAQVKNFKSLAQTAKEATTEVKTFSQLWDVLKETAQSGWTQTWEAVFGDFDTAKKMFTQLQVYFSDIINKFSAARNFVIDGVLNFSKPWTAIVDKLKSVTQVVEKVKGVTDTLEYFQDVVNRVWMGEFNNNGDNPDRRDLLKAAGYDPRVVQYLVNLGEESWHAGQVYKLSVEEVEAAHKKYGLTLEKTAEETEETVVAFNELTDQKLKDAGLTEDEIALYRALEKEAARLGITVEELADKMSTTTGRTLIIESVKNAWKGLVEVLTVVKDAWFEIFNPPTSGEIIVRLYGMLESLHEFSKSLTIVDKETGELTETGDKLMHTFKGVFAVIDLVTTLLGGGLKIAFKALTTILGAFDLDILGFTAIIGDAIVKFRDWVFQENALAQDFEKLVAKLPGAITSIKEWFAAFEQTPAVQKLVTAVEAIGDAFDKLFSGEIDASEFAKKLGTNLGEAIRSLPEIAVQIGKDFIAGFQNGIEFSIGDTIKNIITACLEFVKSFATALGVESPSWKAYETATDFFQGFINGAKDALAPVLNVLKTIGNAIIKVFTSLWDFITDESGNIEWDKLFAGGIILSMVWFLKQIATAFAGIADAFGGLGDIFEHASKVLKSFSKVLNAYAWDIKAKALQKMAIAIAILVASLWVLTTIDDIGKLWNAVGIIAVLALILVGLAVALDKLTSASVNFEKGKGLNVDGLKMGLAQIGIALLLLAGVVKLIGSMNPDEAKQGFLGLAGLAAGLLLFMTVISLLTRLAYDDIADFGRLMLKMSVSMLLLVVVLKMISRLDPGDIFIGMLVMEAFVVLMMQMGVANRLAGQNGKFGGTMLGMAVSMAIMVGVIKLISTLDSGDILTGILVMEGFVLLMMQMGLVNRIGGENGKFGGTMLGMAVAMGIMAIVIKLVGGMNPKELLKGVVVMEIFLVLIAEMLLISKLGKDTGKVAATILGMAGAIAIMAGVAALLSLIDIAGLAKGIIAVGLLSLMVANMAKSLKGAQNVKGAMLMMAIAIGVMAASIVGLSFIDAKSLASATLAMGTLMGMFALMTKAAAKMSPKDTKSILATLGSMLAVVAVLAGILALLTLLDTNKLLAASTSLSLTLVSMAAALALINKINCKGIGTKLIVLTAMVAPLAAFAAALYFMPKFPDHVVDSLKSLISVMYAMALLLVPLAAVGKLVGWSSLIGVLALTTMVAPLAAFVAALAFMPAVPGHVEGCLHTLLPVMTAMSLLLIPLAVIGALANFTVLIGVLALTAMVVPLIAFVAALAFMPTFPAHVEGNLKTLLPVLAIMTLLLIPLSLIGYPAAGAIGGIIALTAMVIPLAAFALALHLLPDVSGTQKTVDLLVGLMTSLTTLLVPLTLIGLLAPFAYAGIGALTALAGFMTAFGAFAAAAGLIMQITGLQEFLDTGISTIEQLSEGLGRVIGLLVGGLIGGIGEGVMASLPGIAEHIKAFMEVMGEVAEIAGKIKATSFDGVVAMTEALLGITIVGVIEKFTSLLPGDSPMDSFKENALAFVDAIAAVSEKLTGVTINEEAITAVANCGLLFVELNKALPRTGGIAQDIVGEKDLLGFAESCKAFAGVMIEVNEAVSAEGFEVQTDLIAKLVSAAAPFQELQNALPKTGGIAQDLAGEQDLAGFAEACRAFTAVMIEINAAVSGDYFVVQSDRIDALAAAGKSFNELNTALPKTGGIAQDLAGEQDLAVFGTACRAFAAVMIDISNAVAAEGFSVNLEAIDALKQAGLKFNELQNALPKTGGWWQDIAGTNDIGDFGAKIKAFGDAMVSYSTSVASLDQTAIDTSISTANRIKSFVESLVGLDASGVNSFAGVGVGDGHLVNIGQAISAYGDEVADLNVDAVSVSVSAASKLKTLIAGLASLDTSGISNFKVDTIGSAMKTYSDAVSAMDTNVVLGSVTAANRLKSFIASLAYLDSSGVSNFKTITVGNALKNYSGAVAGVDHTAIISAISSSNRIKQFIESLVGFSSDGVAKFQSAINELSTINIAGLVEAFSGAAPRLSVAGADMIDGLVKGMRSRMTATKTIVTNILTSIVSDISAKLPMFVQAGEKMMTRMNDGVTSKKSLINSTIKTCVSAAITTARTYYASFHSAGSYLVSGFADGISANSYKASAKAKAMAEAAVDAARKALRINSPSKIFREMGYSVPEGFAMGIDRMGWMVKDSTVAMGNLASKSLSSTISRIADAVNTDIDTQPTIRPVLDLSDVRAGANSIGNMLGGDASVGVMANVGTISTMMNRRSQNGSNAEVVSAIKDLRRDLANAGGNTYHIDGVTYDDGSNISDAVKTIVRAAKMGRRV